ncbi:MAG: single-stranded-DNA-specific exonuclease RecJ [Gammaproteobacteria bacterium]|nr:single-stranded-DNA-specific exonuclease RecJ [Gammaproteobacteria bacterium]
MSIEIRRRTYDVLLEQRFPQELSPVLRRVYAARKVDPAELILGLSGLVKVSCLSGLDAAVERLLQAHAKQEKVLVLGDFDADGATATAVMMSSLSAYGYENISYMVPDRFKFGYGLSVGIADAAAAQAPDLIITVDNGISSVEGVARANELGIDVVVTDHHLPGEQLPAAVAIVNPNAPDNKDFPSKWLAGVGVAFYVMAALGRALATQGSVSSDVAKETPLSCLDLVALGTVADLVQLDYNNRILVEQGVARIRAGLSRPGIEALFNVANRNVASSVAADLGFSIAPRLNAAGRLADMSRGIDCLLASAEKSARDMAIELDNLNKQRRELQQEMQQDAELHLDQLTSKLKDTPEWGYCIFDASWHQGIVGLVATKIRDRVKRPSIAFAPAEAGSAELKGSGRSVKGVHMRDVLANIDAQHPHLIDRFGGHAMAAGLSLQTKNLETFRSAFDAAVAEYKDQISDVGVLESDGKLLTKEINLSLAEAIRNGGPWGQAFPEPIFDNRFRVVDKRIVGGRHLKLKLQPEGSLQPFDAIAFNRDELPRRETGTSDGLYRVAYRLDVNEFRGRRSVQLVVEHMQSD